MRTALRLAGSALLLCGLLIAQGDQKAVLQPGDNLVAEGIPPIPQELVEEVNRYTEFRSAGFESWHPTRREMLITTRFADTLQVHKVSMPGGTRRQLTFFPDRVLAAWYPPKGSSSFIFAKDVGGGEWYQLYRFDEADGNITLLTDGKSRNTAPRWSNAGDRIVYHSTRRNRQDNDLWIMNPSDRKSDRLLAELQGGGWEVYDWSPDDKQVALIEFISINESYIWLLDVATGQKTLFVPDKNPNQKISYSWVRFSKDGRGLWVITDRDSEFQRLAYVDLKNKQHTYYTSHINWDVEDADLSRDGKTIAFITNEDGISTLRLFDTGSRRERPGPKLPSGVITMGRFHENNRELSFSLVSARSPSDVYSLDLPSGKVERWTYSETGGLNTETFSTPELVHWKTFDGKRISGFLYKPLAKFSGRRPLIVNIHGGPEGQARPVFLGRNNYYLNELGVAIIYPNVRGSSGYGKTFLQLDNGERREDTFKDIGALLDWVRTRNDLDPDKILITGGSYGGLMTLAVAYNYDSRICCSVDVVGISNFVTFLERTEAYRRDLRRVEYGDERDPKMREYLERISPVNNAQKITKPIMIVQGANDPRVPLNESEQMVRTIRKNNTPVWYLMAKDEGHGFAKKKNADFQFYSTVMFMREFLLKGSTQRAGSEP